MAAISDSTPNGLGGASTRTLTDAVLEQIVPQDLPLVSVVIAVRNEVRTIERVLRSLLEQNYPSDRLEILVVDGRSTDGSRQRVQAFAQTHPQVRLVDNPRRIVSCAFNLGIANARGSLILILGGHTNCDPNYISECAKPLLDGTADVAGGMMVTVAPDSGAVSQLIEMAMTHRFGVGNNDLRLESSSSRYVDIVGYPLIKREVFEDVGLFDERFVRNVDNELYSRIIRSGRKIYLTVETKSYYISQRRIRGLMRRTWVNGQCHIATVCANPASFRLRYFVPFFFVLALLGSAVGSLFHWTGTLLLAAVGGSYLVAALIATVDLMSKRGWRWFMPFMPMFFLLIHGSYGLGTLVGVFRFALWRRWMRRPSTTVTLSEPDRRPA